MSKKQRSENKVYASYAYLPYNAICCRCDDRFISGYNKDVEITLCKKCFSKHKTRTKKEIEHPSINRAVDLVYKRLQGESLKLHISGVIL